ncbi:hypothetical protein N7462_006135 [Penicillium macrosclerotiorum]|uniref:uncharacterized protein n=1 Tax=Penicillium macrosclerotiorum TaxID=303699 RepID=UPI002549566C|nr:uncharacterized protein N7462_006135 [Penicillium macrosclerotiorum]KAJ5682970.1 hypothetical protein N7462_006135 [Penicillium macrosclerotiorum]
MVAQFEKRLNSPRHTNPIKVDFTPIDRKENDGISRNLSFQSSSDDKTQKLDEYEWLTVMGNFVDALHNFRHASRLQLPQGIGVDVEPVNNTGRKIKIALIDDGVNFRHPSFSNQLQHGKSFDSGVGTNHKVRGAPGSPVPHYSSFTTHGTFMALQIKRMCPDAYIYVFKIDVIPRGDDPPTFRAQSAADVSTKETFQSMFFTDWRLQALESVVQGDFDIISISWTIVRENDEIGTQIDRIKIALQEAANKALVFCSAPDIGASLDTQRHYPYNFKDDSRSPIRSLFRIGAATAKGKTLDWADTPVDYILPGERVTMREDDQVFELDKKPETGSSVATALAAGLAALIIDCVRLAADYNSNGRMTEERVTLLAKIGTPEGMTTAFRAINDGRTGGTLAVESFFRERAKKLENQDISEKEKWEMIASMARLLVPGS